MFIGVNPSKKKVPRLLQMTSSLELQGVQALWPDRSESKVYDLSLCGMSLQALPQFSKLKLQQSLEFKLRIKGLQEHVPVKARLVQVQETHLGLMFESMTVDGRLVLEQADKDQLILNNLRTVDSSLLPTELRGSQWLHGPFDTNWIFRQDSPDAELSQLLVEYENLTLMKIGEDSFLQKSSSAVDGSLSYFGALQFGQSLQKVSQGASWLDRLIKCIEKAEMSHGNLAPVLQWLRKQRVH